MNAKYLKTKLTQAFSLIELMVVVAIIALLTAIAVPSYKTYIAQARIADIFALASDLMTQQLKQQALGGCQYRSASTFSPGTAPPNVSAAQFVSNPSNSTVCSSTGPGGNSQVGTTPTSYTGASTNGWVVVQIPSNNNIDPTNLNGTTSLYWVPTYVSNDSGDATDQTITWTCYVDVSGLTGGSSGCTSGLPTNTSVASYFAIGNSGAGCTCMTSP